MLSFLLPNINEASTWRGLIYVLTSLGLVIKPELQESIITMGLAIAGLIGVLVNDTKSSEDSNNNKDT